MLPNFMPVPGVGLKPSCRNLAACLGLWACGSAQELGRGKAQMQNRWQPVTLPLHSCGSGSCSGACGFSWLRKVASGAPGLLRGWAPPWALSLLKEREPWHWRWGWEMMVRGRRQGHSCSGGQNVEGAVGFRNFYPGLSLPNETWL